ncbi:MAG: MerC domain-containing protein, partial [Saprospiraceae bacterium]|nr:MerC domain-containing protein [Saprospiraceae bacterium]
AKYLDWIGTGASLLCALHCSVLPILLAYSAFQGIAWLGGHTAEVVFITVAVLVAVPAFVAGYRKHRKILPISFALVGFVLIFISLADHQHVAGAPLFLPTMAGILIACGHLLNIKVSKQITRAVATA